MLGGSGGHALLTALLHGLDQLRLNLLQFVPELLDLLAGACLHLLGDAGDNALRALILRGALHGRDRAVKVVAHSAFSFHLEPTGLSA